MVVDATHEPVAERTAQRTRERVVVDEEPAGTLGTQVREISESEEVLGLQPCRPQHRAELRAEGQVLALEIRQRDVQRARGGMRPEVGKKHGRA